MDIISLNKQIVVLFLVMLFVICKVQSYIKRYFLPYIAYKSWSFSTFTHM